MKKGTFRFGARLRYGALSTALLMLTLAVLIGVNLIVTRLEEKHGWRGDYSFNRITTQSETTQTVLDGLTRDVHIYALFEKGSEDGPLLELLDRYAAVSPHVTWEQTPPSLHPTLLTRFATSTKSVTAGSLVVYCEETGRHRLLNEEDFVGLSVDPEQGYQLTLAYEQKITSGIVYVTRDAVPTLHIATGHRELDETALAPFVTLLTENHYDVAFERIADMTFAKEDVLCLLSPLSDLPEKDMETVRAYIDGGGSVLFSCDYNNPLEKMPRFDALLRSYGFVARDGVVYADAEEADSYYREPLMIIPEMQSTSVTLDMMLAGRATLLMIASRAFDAEPETDNSLLVDPVLLTSRKALLQSAEDAETVLGTGPFALALEARRFSSTGDVSRAFVLGSSALLTTEELYTMTDAEEFLIRVTEFLSGSESVSANILTKSAKRPSLDLNALTLGSVMLVLLPLAVLLAGALVLLPRRHL